jgi:hypothetical protein
LPIPESKRRCALDQVNAVSRTISAGCSISRPCRSTYVTLTARPSFTLIRVTFAKVRTS